MPNQEPVEKSEVLYDLRSVHSSFAMILPMMKRTLLDNSKSKEELIILIETLEKKNETLNKLIEQIKHIVLEWILHIYLGKVYLDLMLFKTIHSKRRIYNDFTYY